MAFVNVVGQPIHELELLAPAELGGSRQDGARSFVGEAAHAAQSLQIGSFVAQGRADEQMQDRRTAIIDSPHKCNLIWRHDQHFSRQILEELEVLAVDVHLVGSNSDFGGIRRQVWDLVDGGIEKIARPAQAGVLLEEVMHRLDFFTVSRLSRSPDLRIEDLDAFGLETDCFGVAPVLVGGCREAERPLGCRQVQSLYVTATSCIEIILADSVAEIKEPVIEFVVKYHCRVRDCRKKRRASVD